MLKYGFICLSIWLFSLQMAWAQSGLSVLHLRLKSQKAYQLAINGTRYPPVKPEQTVRNLPAGRYYIEIYMPHGRIMHLDYGGYIDIPAGYELFAVLSRSGKFTVNQAFPASAMPAPPPPMPTQPYQPAPQPNNSYQSPAPTSPTPPANYEAASQIADLTEKIRLMDYDSDRIAYAKTGIAQVGSLYVSELKSLIAVMSFENTKLELAKFAYPYLKDKNQLSSLYDQFKFDTSVEDLKKMQ